MPGTAKNKVSKQRFLKKSAQKTFVSLDRAVVTTGGQNYQKFFASFFQKRSACLLYHQAAFF